MCNKNLKAAGCIALITGILSGAAGCGSMPSNLVQEEVTTAPDVDDVTAANDMEGQNQETERGTETEKQNAEKESKDDEEEVVNAAEFGNPKEVLDGIVITSNIEVIKTEEDELQIEFELDNVGLCTFAVSKGEEFILPGEVFVDSTKIEWTASTADGEFIFPYMRVNESGDMFMIDWTYNGYCFAIYGKSPQYMGDRDQAGKIALEIIRNLGGNK